MRFSSQLRKLEQLSRNFGWKVQYVHIDPTTIGRVYFHKKLIQIDTPVAADALMTLAHELGHVIDYYRRNRDARRHYPKDEKLAYYYGWALLKFIGCTVITKDMWRDFHNDLIK